jgi:CHAT domain-containing protein/Tfp pilus assembly protein PilF
MSFSESDDLHGPYIQPLADSGVWSALVRYWIAHQHGPALDMAIDLVSRRADKEGSRWLGLRAYLSDVREDPMSFDRELPEEVESEVWSREDAATLELVELYPQLALCELAAQFPLEHQEEGFQAGIEGAEGACSLAEFLHDDSVYAFARMAQAGAQKALTDLEAAHASFHEALAGYRVLAEQRPEVYRPWVAAVLNNLGLVQRDIGELESASASYDDALAIYRALAHQQPEVYQPCVAQTLNNLGIVQRDLNDLEAARAGYEEVLRIRRQLAQQRPDVYLPNLATSLNNLGVVQAALNDWEGARAGYEEALATYRVLAQRDPDLYGPLVAMALNNLGTSQYRFKDLETARASYDEALAIRRRLALERPEVYQPQVAVTLNNLGAVRRALNDPEGARASYAEALAIYRASARQRPEIYRPLLANTLVNLGNVELAANNLEAARASYDEALAIYRALARDRPNVYRPSVARTLNGMGNVQRDLVDWEGARASYEEAAHLYEQTIDQLRVPTSYSIERLSCWSNLGHMYLQQCTDLGWPDLRKARDAFRKAFSCAETSRGRFANPRQKNREQENNIWVYESLFEMCVDIYYTFHESQALEEAAMVAEFSRSRRLMELLAEESLQPANVPTGLVEQFKQVRRQFREAERRLQDEVSRLVPAPSATLSDPDPSVKHATRQVIYEHDDYLRGLQGAVERTSLEYDELLRHIQIFDKEFDPDNPVPPVDFAQIRALIPNDVPTAVVQYTITRNRGVALLITTAGVEAVPLPDIDVLQAMLLDFKWLLKNHLFTERLSDTRARLRSEQLEPIAIGAVWPVVKALVGQGIERLIMIPHRELHLLPLHACLLDTGRYLADEFEIVYAPSLSILHRCLDRRRAAPRQLLTIVNPTLDLQFPEYEALAVGRHFPEHTSKCGPEATRRWLMANSAQFEVWHYSGHSVFNLADPLASAIKLVDVDRPEEWLTLRDVFMGLRLSETTLAVLSSCESGGLRPDDIDEYVGLPSGFLYAGATCVVSSFWEVDDLATTLLMDRFYDEWMAKGRSVGSALREAQRWLREDIADGRYLMEHVVTEDFLSRSGDPEKRESCRFAAEAQASEHPDSPPFAAPKYWAAFFCTGMTFPRPNIARI